MKEVLDLSIEIVNYIKAVSLNSRLFKLLSQDMQSEHAALLFYTNVRWLSKGNMLKRLHKLKEVAIFLDSRKKKNWNKCKIFTKTTTSEKFSPHCGVVDSALVLRYHGCSFESQLAGH